MLTERQSLRGGGRLLAVVLLAAATTTAFTMDLVSAQYQQHPPQQQQQQQGYGSPQQLAPGQQVQMQYTGQQQLHPGQQVVVNVPHGQNGVPQYQQATANVLHDQARIHDKEHLKEHLHGILNDPDLSKMSEEELQFHYFKLHDNDNNNMLDGSELIKSLIHWHVEENKHLGANANPQGTTKIFTDLELAQMIDPILDMDDKNRDGFIDYPEFVAAQKARGF